MDKANRWGIILALDWGIIMTLSEKKWGIILALDSVYALEPDLVILDEFQRFKHLLDGEDEVAKLAKAVFEYEDAKVILLSATPYKMYTMYHESELEDHYIDFLRTIKFLFDSDEKTNEFKSILDEYRKALLTWDSKNTREIVKIKRKIESSLRKIMVRTERISITHDQDAMIELVRLESSSMEPEDFKAFRLFDSIARHLAVGDMVEYWKSAPYLLNMMDKENYKIKKVLVSRIGEDIDKVLKTLINNAKNGLLSYDLIRKYRQLDPENAKLRMLLNHKIESGGWKLLWIPPSLPYYHPTGSPFTDPEVLNFTKSLVFSNWYVVPKVISIIASYEAERHMVVAFDHAADYATERQRRSPLLRFTMADGRFTGMSVFPLIYPCLTFATRIDPLSICTEISKDGSLPTEEEIIQAISQQIKVLLDPIVDRYRNISGRIDERWYWAALALLDRKYYRYIVDEWLRMDDKKWSWSSMVESREDSEGHFGEHIGRFREYIDGLKDLGRPPQDLYIVLSKIALASPGVVALRSLFRLINKNQLFDEPTYLLSSAARVAMGFRNLFNLSESMTLICSLKQKEESRYWESVLEYCINGNLQSVMDEYVHILKDSLGLIDVSLKKIIDEITQEINRAISIRTVNLDFDEIIKDSNSMNQFAIKSHSMRCRFALRFGDEKQDELGEETRSDQVRSAFNSPFRPFILATTSIGQEGLDFHQYCHEVYHWNLPSNPVDLEQREGRVHRYKGHVIRRNIAKHYMLSVLKGQTSTFQDPWEILFEKAKKDRPPKVNDLIPYWIFETENGYNVYRYIPALPLSREKINIDYLRRSLVVYRMIMGQPRQEDILHFIQSSLHGKMDLDDLEQLQINLSPI